MWSVKNLRTFKEFLDKGFIKKRNIDRARARNLIKGADKRKKVMEKYLPLNEETANQIVEECYDIIRELLEAKLSVEGYKSYNHEAVVSYLGELGFPRSDVDFLDRLREVRHGVKYYGKSIGVNYASLVLDFLHSIYSNLMEIVVSE